jgi:hypothetical protein
MAKLFVWSLLVGIFLLAGYGLNLIRIAIVDKLADPSTVIWWRVLIGAVLMTGGIGFLGGFVYYRDKKRNKIRPPAWKQGR